MAYHLNRELFANVIEAAVIDQEFKARLLENPVRTMNSVGLCIPEFSFEEFNITFRKNTDPLLAEAERILNAGVPLSVRNLPSFSCAACTVSVWTVAALITAVTAGGLALLTVTSGPVLALASFAGVPVAAALAFIKTLGVAIGSGVAAVAKAICRWIGACP